MQSLDSHFQKEYNAYKTRILKYKRIKELKIFQKKWDLEINNKLHFIQFCTCSFKFHYLYRNWEGNLWNFELVTFTLHANCCFTEPSSTSFICHNNLPVPHILIKFHAFTSFRQKHFGNKNYCLLVLLDGSPHVRLFSYCWYWFYKFYLKALLFYTLFFLRF